MSRQNVALVTGGTGFIGSHVVRKLVNDGWETHLIVRSTSDTGIFKELEQKLHFHIYDKSTESLCSIVKKVSPRIAFHLASKFLAQHTASDIQGLIETNILFATQLAEALSRNGVQYMINTGTSWQHYENKAYSPVCLYAATKQAIEDILQYYVETQSLRLITLKLFDTYGPNDPRQKLFYLLSQLVKTKEVLLMSPGEQLIDIVHVEDVVDAYMLAAKRLLSGTVHGHEQYSVSSGHQVPLKKLVSTYEHILGKKLPIHWGGRPYRKREVMEPWTKGTEIPGWKPKIMLTDGIKELIRSQHETN